MRKNHFIKEFNTCEKVMDFLKQPPTATNEMIDSSYNHH